MTTNISSIRSKEISQISRQEIFNMQQAYANYDISIPPSSNISNGVTVYDTITQKLFYNNNGNWQMIQNAITGGTGATKIDSISLIKISDDTILGGSFAIINGFTGSPQPYISISGWDLTTGIYTAPNIGLGMHSIDLDVNISWKGGISNLGTRTLNVIYKKVSSSPIIIKGVSTQADANAAVETTQELSTVISDIQVGDQIWLEVMHNSPVNLILSGGYATSICGYRVYTIL